ncbi:hypothetical protein [Xylophilus sp.]|uniref:hypothetical protein n=1 Tax=Xylophilus sp. TaxID=2653893 RepID=UPI0013BB44E1|nr:hypothetical protein [Xylophilus sp.]KAF1044701.1 MAG: hypothetical protein GAK38_03419 [Xylophilus sp.]
MSATAPDRAAAPATDPLLPLALYQANLTLWLRTSALLAEGRAQWIALGVQTLRGGIEETRSETDDLLRGAGWQTLAALPTHALAQALQHQVAAAQGVVQTAISNQAAFGAGYRAALAEWREAAAQAVGRAWQRAGTATPAAVWAAAVQPQQHAAAVAAAAPADRAAAAVAPQDAGTVH